MFSQTPVPLIHFFPQCLWTHYQKQATFFFHCPSISQAKKKQNPWVHLHTHKEPIFPLPFLQTSLTSPSYIGLIVYDTLATNILHIT